MTTDGGYAALESLDGRWLYYTRLDRPGLLRRAAAGGADEMVAADVRAENWPNWGVLDRGVFFLTWPDDGDPQLALLVAQPTPAAPADAAAGVRVVRHRRLARRRAGDLRALPTGATPTSGA